MSLYVPRKECSMTRSLAWGITARRRKGLPVRAGNIATQTTKVGKGIPVGREMTVQHGRQTALRGVSTSETGYALW